MTKPNPINKEVLWDKTKIIISETDSFGTITSVNSVFSDVSGYTIDELVGQPHSIIRHPDMPKIIFKMLWENLKQGNNFIGIVKNLAKSGRYYWVVTDFEIHRDETGNIFGYVGKRKAVPQSVVDNYVAPFYETLLKLEKIGGIELSHRFFKNYLVKQGKDYIDFIISILSEAESDLLAAGLAVSPSLSNGHEQHEVPDSIYHVNNAMNEKRKSFFEKLFATETNNSSDEIRKNFFERLF
ncbi:PAS domain-containing protein [Capnocytophaga sp.]|uniref:PAS domain-containing protein n=1 Tax=Capnocytophaga sp. TaxID=44737 RepID=UPI0026DA9636|nr:PAS domain-containing protein [Capnocytophaga sp.]MDO5105148.1 PAS domain-containing protein [Capnocytophaga sp.]